MIMMAKTRMQSRSLNQDPPMTGVLQNRLRRVFIQMFSCCVVISCIFASVSCEISCLNQEMQSLLAFKSALHDPADHLASWNVSFTCCRWEGISCDSRTGHVVAVDLHNCTLSGLLRPAALLNLTALEHLDVSFNNFTNLPIPTETGLLKNLKYLNLSTAGFAGTVPWQLGNLSNLTGLDLTSPSSMLTSPDLSWLANLTALTNLSLNGVHISATSSSWGQSVSRLSQLLNVTMTDCGFTGSIPRSLQKLRYLQTLHLDKNTFQSGFPTWLANMTSLIDLQLSNANLSGSLPFELSQMPRLGSISLANNKLSANVSQIFRGQWKGLTFFQMPNNSLYGSIPSTIGKLSSLAQLQLHTNNLGGTIPESLGLLRSLTVLNLGYNKLTGPIPLSLGSLSKLTNISLTHNALSGAISESHFRSLNNLKYLDLSNNKLAFKITSNWTPPFDLDTLILSHCQIDGSFPLFLKTQTSLTTLILSNNTLKGQIPSWLWSLPKLETLVLSHNQLEGPIPPQLYNSFTSLKQVELRDNQLHGNLPNSAGSSVAGFPWELDLSINRITGPIPREICMMLHTSNFLSLASNKVDGQIPGCICEKAEFLEALDLSGNKLSGLLPSSLSNCSSLKVLNVANNGLEGQIPVKLGKLNKLQVLHINSNRLSGHVPSSLRNCKMLEILDLSRNSISGNVPEWIADLSKLRILVLRSNNLVGEIPIQVSYLQKLQILDLAMNRLSGSIPPDLSKLLTMRNGYFSSSGTLKYANNFYKEEVILMVKNHTWAYKYILSLFTSLDLSANNLSGDIPEDIGDLKGLHSLNLSHNHLTGRMPQELGEMTNLEALDISCNQLWGRIPKTFADLNSLGYLNLSNNNLSGRIPDSQHLDTFGASSFWGNPELCGTQVQRNCSDYTSNSGQGDEGDDRVHWWELWEVGMAMGTAIGFGSVIGVLALSRGLRKRYYQFVDSILNMF